MVANPFCFCFSPQISSDCQLAHSRWMSDGVDEHDSHFAGLRHFGTATSVVQHCSIAALHGCVDVEMCKIGISPIQPSRAAACTCGSR